MVLLGGEEIVKDLVILSDKAAETYKKKILKDDKHLLYGGFLLFVLNGKPTWEM